MKYIFISLTVWKRLNSRLGGDAGGRSTSTKFSEILAYPYNFLCGTHVRYISIIPLNFVSVSINTMRLTVGEGVVAKIVVVAKIFYLPQSY